MSPEPEPHTLAGAYVLGALSEAESSEFADHLRACPECRDEIRELREVSARLAIAEAVTAPPDLRGRTLAAARRLSQAGPGVTSGPALEAGLGSPAGGALMSTASSGSARRAGRGLAPSPGVGEVPGRPSSRRWRRWSNLSRPLAIGLAVVLVASGVSGGVIAYQARQQAMGSQQREHMISEIMTAPDAVILTAKISTGGSAAIVMSRRMAALVFSAHGLVELPPAKAYELWLMGPEGDKPAGILRVREAGMADPAVVSGLRPGDMLGLTVEPAAGSARPTSAPIVLIGMKTH